MGNKIAPIKKDYGTSQIKHIEQQLAANGYTRFPGTSETVLPYKETSGKYRTGLDPDAPYLLRLPDESREAEVKRIKEVKKRIEDSLGVPGILDPTSLFWNYAASDQALTTKFGTILRVTPVKLGNEEEYFNFTNDPMREIAWNWIKVHPRIAPSYDAWKRGEVAADTKYYIVDDDAEATETFSKKKAINNAVIELDRLTPTKRKQIARLMGLPVTESTTEEVVYNLLDSQIKESELKEGPYKGQAPVRLFTDLVKTTDDRLKVKDLVEQAITHNIYRFGVGGKILEGAVTIAITKDELVENLLKDTAQLDVIALEKRLTGKKLEKL